MIELLLIQPLPATDALDTLRSAYSSGVVADRMTYETRRSDGTFDAVAAVLRLAGTDTGPEIRYETSGFAFHAQTRDRVGVLTGAGLGPPEPRRVLRIERPGQTAAEVLTGALPTGPMPQLWTINGTAVSDPALGAIQFTAASIDRGTTTITGESAFGPILLQTDAAGRVITLRAPLRDGSIELRAAPTEPGDPRSWSLDTDRRRLVSRIDQLAPNLAMLSTGDILPDVSMQTPDGIGLALADWHDAPPNDAPRAPWSLIVFADATSADPAGALRAAAGVLAAVTSQAESRSIDAAPAERFWLRFRPLVVLVMPEDAAFNTDTNAARPDLADVDVLYSTRPDLTIDRLPLVPIIAVAIDRDRVIGAMSAPTNSGAEAPLDAVRFVDQLLVPASNPAE